MNFQEWWDAYNETHAHAIGGSEWMASFAAWQFKATMHREYHGWILIEKGAVGYRDIIWVERPLGEEKGKSPGRQRHQMTSAAAAIEWWDREVGERIQLEEVGLGASRVFTEVAEDS